MTAAERNAVYEASLAAWCGRIAPVLADVDASRALALAVVGLLLRLFAPTKGSMPHPVWMLLAKLESLTLRIELSGGALPCEHEWCPMRERGCRDHVTDFAAVRRWAWHAGGKARGFPWLETIASCLCRACEDEALLTRGAEGKVKCWACDGRGRVHGFGEGPCPRCDGQCWQPSEPVAPPLLALLLHDAHSLLTELHVGTVELDALLREHVDWPAPKVHDPLE